jgi:hypothetical protein
MMAAESEAGADRWRRYHELSSRVDEVLFANVDEFDIPNGCVFWVVSDDDPELTEWVIQRGAEEVRRGRNVYFRHARVADLPPARPSRDNPPGSRRIEYAAGGTVRRVTVLAEDGAWRDVEPTPEDTAGLPPATGLS